MKRKGMSSVSLIEDAEKNKTVKYEGEIIATHNRMCESETYERQKIELEQLIETLERLKQQEHSSWFPTILSLNNVIFETHWQIINKKITAVTSEKGRVEKEIVIERNENEQKKQIKSEEQAEKIRMEELQYKHKKLEADIQMHKATTEIEARLRTETYAQYLQVARESKTTETITRTTAGPQSVLPIPGLTHERGIGPSTAGIFSNSNSTLPSTSFRENSNNSARLG